MTVLLAGVILSATVILNPTSTHAANLYFGPGIFIPYAGRLSNSSTGSPSIFSPILPDLVLTGQFSSLWDFGISPVLGYTVFGHKSVDGGEKSTYLPFALRINKSFGLFDFRFGPGVLFYSISGAGGTSVQSNGSSTTTYALPSNSTTSRLLFFDMGTGINFDPFRVDLDGLISGTFSSRRAVSLMLTVSYGIF